MKHFLYACLFLISKQVLAFTSEPVKTPRNSELYSETSLGFTKFNLSTDIVFVPYGFGRWSSNYLDDSHMSGDLSTIRLGGKFSIMGVLFNKIRMGGFIRDDSGQMKIEISENTKSPSRNTVRGMDFSCGFSVFIGSNESKKWGAGAGLDIGALISNFNLEKDDTRIQPGVMASTRLAIVSPTFAMSKLKGSVCLSFGLEYFINFGKSLDYTDDVSTTWCRIQTVILVGLLLGK